LDGDFGTGHAAAAKGADFALLVLNHAVAGGVNSKVSAHFGAVTGALGHAGLTDDNLAGFDLLAAIQLHPEALARAIVDVFGGTAGFDMTHFFSLCAA